MLRNMKRELHNEIHSYSNFHPNVFCYLILNYIFTNLTSSIVKEAINFREYENLTCSSFYVPDFLETKMLIAIYLNI